MDGGCRGKEEDSFLNNYYPPLRNIIHEYRLLGIHFLWKPGDQEQKIIAQNYGLLGDCFPWDPGG